MVCMYTTNPVAHRQLFYLILNITTRCILSTLPSQPSATTRTVPSSEPVMHVLLVGCQSTVTTGFVCPVILPTGSRSPALFYFNRKKISLDRRKIYLYANDGKE